MRLVTVVGADASSDRLRGVETFHGELAAVCPAPTESVIVERDDVLDGAAAAAGDTDLTVVGHDPQTVVHDSVLGDRSSELGEALDVPVLFVNSRMPGSTLRRLVTRALF